MPCLQKNGAVTPQYRQRLCPPGQGHFFHAVLAHSGRAPVSKTTGRWFESTRMKTKTFCKQKTASVSLRWRAFYGRGWITQAAHLKKPRRGFFARRDAKRRALRVALADFSATPWRGLEKSERCPSLASLFPPQAVVGSAAVRIHPRK